MLSGTSDERIQAAFSYGKNLGISFQVSGHKVNGNCMWMKL